MTPTGFSRSRLGALPAPARGAQPDLPERVRADRSRRCSRSDPEHVRHAAMLDPNAAGTLSLDQIWALCDDLTEAHGDALPAALRVTGIPATYESEDSMTSRARVLIGLAALAAASTERISCGGDDDGGSSGGKTKLTFWHGQTELWADCLATQIAEFNRTHKNIQVSSDTGGVVADRMLQKVTAGLRRATTPTSPTSSAPISRTSRGATSCSTSPTPPRSTSTSSIRPAATRPPSTAACARCPR